MIGLAFSGVLDIIGQPTLPVIIFGCAGIVFGIIRVIKKTRLKRRMMERGSLYY